MTVVTEAAITGNSTLVNITDINSTDGNLVVKTTVNYYGLIYTSLLFVIGIPGNIIVFFVYSKKLRKNSTTIFILVLAVFDLINCTVTLPTEIVMLLNPFVFHIGPVCKMSRFTTYTCNGAAAVILAAIAIDRYKRVCRPHGKQITTVRAKKMACLALLVSVSFTWLSLVIYGPRTVIVNTTSKNISLRICEIDDSHVLTVYPLIYYSYMCFSTCGIYFILLSCYICIVVKMVKRQKFTSLISRRSVSNKEVPNIHIEHPSSQCHPTNALQVTSVHSSTRSLNVCCRTEESNCFQYEPASSINTYHNKAESEHLKQQLDSNILKPDGFLNIDMLVPCNAIQGKERASLPEQGCTNKKEEEESNQKIYNQNKKFLEIEECNYAIQKSQNLEFPSTSNSHENKPTNRRKSSSNLSICESKSGENKDKYHKPTISHTQSHTGEPSQNGSTKSKMRPSKRSLRTHRLGKTTLMLLVVTAIYILSFLPFLAVVIQRSIYPVFPLIYNGEYDMLYESLYRSYLLNCAVNPVIYSFCNANFRKDCRAACRRRKLFYR